MWLELFLVCAAIAAGIGLVLWGVLVAFQQAGDFSRILGCETDPREVERSLRAELAKLHTERVGLLHRIAGLEMDVAARDERNEALEATHKALRMDLFQVYRIVRDVKRQLEAVPDTMPAANGNGQDEPWEGTP